MDIFDRAIIFAVEAHQGQRRKNGGTYIVHPLETASIAATLTDDREILSASVLHDTVEDTAVTIEEIENKFGKRVAELVASETENKRRSLSPESTWRERKEESLELLRGTKDVAIKIIWLSDKLANVRSFYREHLIYGDEIWRNFNQKDPKQQHWYYRTVAKLMDGLKDTPAWLEYDRLINEVFGTDIQ